MKIFSYILAVLVFIVGLIVMEDKIFYIISTIIGGYIGELLGPSTAKLLDKISAWCKKHTTKNNN